MGGRRVKIAVDTNILARAVLLDDPVQGRLAADLLQNASLIAISLPCLCELVWVLRRGAKLSNGDIAQTIRDLLETDTVTIDRPAVEAGLVMLEAGGDFADGVMAHEGAWLGGETFVSFDRKAIDLLSRAGQAAQLLR